MKDNTAKAVFCAALGNIIWGFSFLFTKVGLAIAPDPNVMLAHRFTMSTLLMLVPILLGLKKISFKSKEWKPVSYIWEKSISTLRAYSPFLTLPLEESATLI